MCAARGTDFQKFAGGKVSFPPRHDPGSDREIAGEIFRMSVSVMRSLVCVLALGGVAALQVHPDSRLSTPRPMLRATTLVAAAAAAEDEGKAGLTASTANLVKSIVGSGVLSLPVGVAAFSSARTAILPALTLLAVAGAISGYCAPFAAAAPPHVAHAAPHASLHAHQHHAPCCSPPPPS